MDDRSFDAALIHASESRWSGMLRAMKDDEQVGVVFMREGHVAWAVSNSQTENFGSFLERIGMVPKERLNEVVQKYRALGKTKKLGALLEEAGLISRAALRECLKAHVRAALAAMRRDPLITFQARDGEMSIDASLVFLLSEVFPETGENIPETSGESEENTAPSPPEPPSADGGLLEELGHLPGYLYSFVADTAGEVLSLHAADGVQPDIDRILPGILAWIRSSLGMDLMEMGMLQLAFIQSEKGSLFAHMTCADNRYFLAVACDDTAKLGVIKHKVAEQLSIVQRFLEKR